MIQLKNIEKIYNLGGEPVHALQSVSLEIAAGEYVAIMGSSGSGKSTLMHIIGCLDQPDNGTYKLDGQEVQSLSEDELADVRNKKIGFVFQQFNLLPRMDALENVTLPLIYAGLTPAKRTERAANMLRLVGLGERMGHRPSQLSGGQQQRVSIARALVNKPAVLLADEPTGALDSQTSEEIMALLAELHKEGTTIILVTHEPDIATFAHRLVKLKDGLITSDQIIRKPG
ncbi:MAG: ABC transporter ATP-binding protein [Candidatus Obscuribacterales bacterium]|nr:ABC transporter ATP-binding protein [Candidatus Obscuribacterales bacterium]